MLISKKESPEVANPESGKQAKEYQEKVVTPSMRENAKDLQQCYLTHLKSNPSKTEGVIQIVIKIEDDGKISSVQIAKSDFTETGISECLASKIQSYHLAPPPLGINQFISHTLAFKSEENAMREAVERETKGKLPKVLPVDGR